MEHFDGFGGFHHLSQLSSKIGNFFAECLRFNFQDLSPFSLIFKGELQHKSAHKKLNSKVKSVVHQHDVKDDKQKHVA